MPDDLAADISERKKHMDVSAIYTMLTSIKTATI